jgi:hypothetical protein
MTRRISWFEFGLALFGAALPIGVLLMLAAPLHFFHALGAAVVAMGLIGFWVSALGLKLEHPERWAQIRTSMGRLATASSPPRRPAQRQL